jgi:hypothetical protein
MTIEEFEAQVLRLDAQSRARLAGKLLESLEMVSPEENAPVWAEEARRRDAELESDPGKARSADQVYRDARARLG